MKSNKNSNKYKVIRSGQAGVFYGELESLTVENSVAIARMKTARRIWYWSGAATLSQLATEGVKHGGQCKFSMETKDHLILGVIEVLDLTEAAKANLDAVPVWKI